MLADLDKTTLPRERNVFGVESDIDGDGRVGLIFSPLTKNIAVAFFAGCDLLPSLTGCGAGNGGRAPARRSRQTDRLHLQRLPEAG